MLTKLIRHEFRATSRIMWPIFAGMLALTLAMRASQNVLQNESPWLLNLLAVLVTIGFVFGIMALCFAPLVLSAVRFRDHLLKDEGYLTLTLPVNMHQLLASKLIVSAVWYAAAFLAVVLLCMIGAFDFSDWRVVPQFASDLFLSFRKLDNSMQGQALLFALEVFLFCVLGVTAVSLIVYAAYAVGFSFNKHKSALTAVSVLVFFQLVQFAAIAVLVNLFGDGFTAWSPHRRAGRQCHLCRRPRLRADRLRHFLPRHLFLPHEEAESGVTHEKISCPHSDARGGPCPPAAEKVNNHLI